MCKGRRADMELFRLVNPSAHSSTSRLKNNLLTSAHLSWSFQEAEWKELFRGKGAVSAWCVVFEPSAYSSSRLSTEFFLR